VATWKRRSRRSGVDSPRRAWLRQLGSGDSIGGDGRSEPTDDVQSRRQARRRRNRATRAVCSRNMQHLAHLLPGRRHPSARWLTARSDTVRRATCHGRFQLTANVRTSHNLGQSLVPACVSSESGVKFSKRKSPTPISSHRNQNAPVSFGGKSLLPVIARPRVISQKAHSEPTVHRRSGKSTHR
jgi:hypothetical protein